LGNGGLNIELTFDMSSFQVIQEPIQLVLDRMQEKLIQIIRDGKPIDIVESILREQVVDRVNISIIEYINIHYVQQYQAHMPYF
jgi:hypothetical protein